MRRNLFIQARSFTLTQLITLLGVAIACVLFGTLLPAQPAHADDDYMRSIRSEAQKLEPLDQHSNTGSDSDDKSLRDFEAALLQDSPDSFRLYQQLAPEKRLTVFQLYQQSHDLTSVRRRIIELRLGS
jgi:hypothetical protein